MARTTNLTRQLRDDVLARVDGGAVPRRAAQACGIPGATWDRWMERAKTEPGADPELVNMTTDKLKALADEFGVTVPTNGSVQELAAILEAADVNAWDDYRAFRAEIERVDANAEVRMTVAVQVASTDNPKAMLDFMERRWRRDWSRKDTLLVGEAEADNDEQQRTINRILADERLLDLAEALNEDEDDESIDSMPLDVDE